VCFVSGADRQRSYKDRQRLGTIIVPVLVNEAALSIALVEAKLLEPNLADDRQSIEQALQKLINEFQGIDP
jgi:hypothetical protein